MNQEHICDFSLPLSLEIAAMRAGSLPPPPAWIPATVFPLLWPFMDLSLIRLAQTKSGWLSKQAGSKSNLYCFVIGVTIDRQTLDRNHIQGGGLFILAHVFGAFSLWSLVHWLRAGEAELEIMAVRLEECGRRRLAVHLPHSGEKQKAARDVIPWGPAPNAVLPLTMFHLLTLPEPPTW